jgi:hypothetical protein
LALKDILERHNILVPILCLACACTMLVTALSSRKAALMSIARKIVALAELSPRASEQELKPRVSKPARAKSARSRLSNGHLPNSHTPGGSTWVRRLRDLIHQLAHPASFAELPMRRQQAVKTAASAILMVEQFEAQLAVGKDVDLAAYRLAIATSARLQRQLDQHGPPIREAEIELDPVSLLDAHLMGAHGATRNMHDNTHVPKSERPARAAAILRKARERAIAGDSEETE